MSVMDYLSRKHKVMNCVFEILYDLYGEPSWLKKPKDGQDPEKIIEQWITELGGYGEVQLRQACYKLVNNGTIKLHNGKVNEEEADLAIAAIRQPMKSSKNDNLADLNNLSTVLLKTRIKSELEKVKYLEIKNKEAEKTLVSADGVRIAAFNKGRMVRDALLNIPDRVASMLAKETDTNRIHEILTKEIRQIIEEILESG